MKAVAYCRVSTEQQAIEGISLSAQEEKIRKWADVNGYDEVEVFIDRGISGKRKDNRPGLQDAINSVGNGDCLIVYSLSRLSRSTKDCIELSELLMAKNADLVSLSEKIDTTSASGKMLFRLLSVFGEFERDLVSERTKLALSHKKANGEKTGGLVPYGSKLDADDKTLVDDNDEQSIINECRQLKEAGLSLRKISCILESRGMLSRNGKPFDAKQIQRMVSAC